MTLLAAGGGSVGTRKDDSQQFSDHSPETSIASFDLPDESAFLASRDLVTGHKTRDLVEPPTPCSLPPACYEGP